MNERRQKWVQEAGRGQTDTNGFDGQGTGGYRRVLSDPAVNRIATFMQNLAHAELGGFVDNGIPLHAA